MLSMASAYVEYRCFVGGLAWATDDHALEKAFSHYGNIVESKVRLLQPSHTTPKITELNHKP